METQLLPVLHLKSSRQKLLRLLTSLLPRILTTFVDVQHCTVLILYINWAKN